MAEAPHPPVDVTDGPSLVVRVAPEVARALRARAKAEDISVTTALRRAIGLYLESSLGEFGFRFDDGSQDPEIIESRLRAAEAAGDAPWTLFWSHRLLQSRRPEVGERPGD